MKLLITLALFAVALADEINVVSFNLPEAPSPDYTIPSIGQLIIPNEVLESWKKDLDAIDLAVPVMRDEVIPDEEALKVQFVDNVVPEPVKLGEAPQPVYESAPDAIEDGYPMDFGIETPFDDAPLEAIAPEPIKTAEPVLAAVETAEVVEDLLPEAPDAIEYPMDFGIETPFDDAPLEAVAPEPINIAEPVLPAVETAEVVEALLPEAPDAIEYPMDFGIETPFDDAPLPINIAEPVLPAAETAEVPVEPIKIPEPESMMR